MIWAAFLAAGVGAGAWLIARALVPPARPLHALADELVRPRTRPPTDGGGRSALERAVGRLAGEPSERLAADLAVIGRTPVRHTTDKLIGAVVGLAVGAFVVVALPAAGSAVAPTAGIVVAVLLAAGGWVVPDADVRSKAVAARRAWSQAVTVYVDIVGISLAGGAGVEDALMVAARAGSGPQFAELDAALRAARTRRRKLWQALDDLGAKGDVMPLRELAAAVDLAAESGSRIRETLLAKAEALRVRQLTDAEADAQRASETMGIAPALMAIAAVVLIGYPAVARFFEP